ncbi:MAG: uracil-DNA glycosylase [Thiohalomonadales bacterium]
MTNNLTRNQYLSIMGINVWVERDNINTRSYTKNSELKTKVKSELMLKDITSLDWNELDKTVNQCQNCNLYKTRKNSVFGSGNKNAKLFIIGSIPNIEEDNKSQIFIGTEGILLDNMLKVLDLSRSDVFTTNILKCKSQKHRQFTNAEMDNCFSYLKRQIDLVKPKVLIIFGEQVAQFILKIDKSMTTLITEMYDYNGISVIVIKHPEQLLLSGSSKKQAWLSLQKIRTILN